MRADLITDVSQPDVPYDMASFTPPAYGTAEEERAHRKQTLAITFRLFGKFGFGEGAAGHVTARDPELSDHLWVNPLGKHFSCISPSDLLLVDPAGRVVEGTGQVNVAAYVIHSTVHEVRPDVVAAAHTHSVYGKTFSTLNKELAPLTQDACAFFEDHALFDDFTGLVVTMDEGERLAEALGSYKAAILRNHGLLTVGRTVEECAWWYLTLERSCQSQLMAESAGVPHVIDDDTARFTAESVGSEVAALINFAPLKELILHEQPDLLD